MIKKSWEMVSEKTIANCWRHCGFNWPETNSLEIEPIDNSPIEV